MVGDLQGCCTPLEHLLAHPAVTEDSNARFWFAGDLVNRGPQSLATLRRLIALENRAVTVLGNHDLHLLGVAAGVRPFQKLDTIQEILEAKDAHQLIDWIRTRPLVHFEQGHLLIHAGLLAKWDVSKTLALAAEVQDALRSPNWKEHLQKMFGNHPVKWKENIHHYKRLRIILNALTRLRLCTPRGKMILTYKSLSKNQRASALPWFDVPNRATRHVTVVFGHWSELGLLLRDDVICLDTGCVWGGALTAVRLQDRKLVQIACAQTHVRDPSKGA